jgi:DNA (cytosine-5)-methyltransferase 1
VRPRLLDLFCGAGGCSVGYERAGFDVVGVDINPQPNYPFEFVQMDALLAFAGQFSPQQFDAIHASPPCQDYSRALRHMAAPQPRLIDPVRDLLEATGLPWVIENVPGAPIPTQSTLDGRHGVELCGTQFGLRVGRHRLFEANFPLDAPAARCRCSEVLVMNPHNQAGRDRIYAEFGKQNPDPLWNAAMGVPWMNKHEGREAIPPAYTEFIGHQLLTHLNTQKEKQHEQHSSRA